MDEYIDSILFFNVHLTQNILVVKGQQGSSSQHKHNTITLSPIHLQLKPKLTQESNPNPQQCSQAP